MVQTSGKCPRIDNVSEFYLWHCRLGHINKNRLNRLAQEGILEVGDCESLPTCESCLLGKMTKSPFTEKGEQANELLGLIHFDRSEEHTSELQSLRKSRMPSSA